jgi:hypothetical protein
VNLATSASWSSKYWAGDEDERKGEVGSDDVGERWDLSNQWEMYESGSVCLGGNHRMA